jgi:indolepyruvate ferredoxin oxidoreductase
VFANLGDGTYFHSGLLAVRQSIAAKVNITYKILYNDAVAMTGGQPLDGTLGVPAISRELQAEGVGRIAIVSDEPEKYDGCTDLAGGATVHHRDELDTIQRQMRELPGCTVIIYDQTCATEKRRRRKRGTMAQATKHVVINELVCEGCGDCSVQSNCLSVEPVDTEFGRKRRINQSTCNQDTTCVKGLCPSLVTVEGGTLRKKHQADKRIPSLPHDVLPEPSLPRSTSAYGIVVAGIGGTGVITIGQLLGVAAHIEGKGIVTQDAAGLAQKGGATWSHIQIADSQQAIHTTRVSTGAADLVIACDPLVAAQPATLGTMAGGRTRVALNVHGTPSAAFVNNAKWQFPGGRRRRSWRWRHGRRPGPECRRAAPARRGQARRQPARHGPAGRYHLCQSLDAGLRLAEGLGAAEPRRHPSSHRAQRGTGGQQPGCLRMGPPGRARSGCRATPGPASAARAVDAEAWPAEVARR